jgi:hypothetical protein
MKYHLFSERCSGSNYFEAALAANFPGLEPCYDYGYKHWLIPRFLDEQAFPSDRLYVLVNRNPIDWLRSIHTQPWHAAHHLRGISFSDFIRAEWQCVWDEQAGIAPEDPRWMREMEFERNPLNQGAHFANIIEVRRVKYHIWRAKLSGQPRLLCVNFDLFLKDPSSILQRLSLITDQLMPEPIVLPTGYKGRMSWRRRLLHRASMGLISEKVRKSPKCPINSEDLAFILSNIDHDQEQCWGYDAEALAASCNPCSALA